MKNAPKLSQKLDIEKWTKRKCGILTYWCTKWVSWRKHGWADENTNANKDAHFWRRMHYFLLQLLRLPLLHRRKKRNNHWRRPCRTTASRPSIWSSGLPVVCGCLPHSSRPHQATVPAPIWRSLRTWGKASAPQNVFAAHPSALRWLHPTSSPILIRNSGETVSQPLWLLTRTSISRCVPTNLIRCLVGSRLVLLATDHAAEWHKWDMNFQLDSHRINCRKNRNIPKNQRERGRSKPKGGGSSSYAAAKTRKKRERERERE